MAWQTEKKDRYVLARKNIAWVIVCLALVPLSAYAGTLVGKKAQPYLKDLQQKLVNAEYYAVALERRNDDPATANRFDAVIFSRLGRTYKVIRRLDQDHALVLNASEGEDAERVTNENFAYYARLIDDNAMQPEVVVDKDGRELLIVYCGLSPCRVITHKSGDGQLSVEVRKYLLQSEPDRFLPLTLEPEF